MSLSLESPILFSQRWVSVSSTSPMILAHLLRTSSMSKPGRLPNNPTPLPETITIITVNIIPRHISLNNESLHISSRDSTSRYLNLPLGLNIRSLDPWNRPTSPQGLTASANLPCPMISPHSIHMVSQILLLVLGFKTQVCSRSLPLVDLLRGCLTLDRLSFTIPINKSDVGYLVELLHPYL
jgi:hypothetical protein